jgi:hypothetical protein
VHGADRKADDGDGIGGASRDVTGRHG